MREATVPERARRRPVRIQQYGCDRVSRKSPAASVHWSSTTSPASTARPDPRGGELGADLGAHPLAGGEADLEAVEPGDPHDLVGRATSRISIHASVSSQWATWSQASGSKSAPSSRLSTASTLRLNAAVTPAASS